MPVAQNMWGFGAIFIHPLSDLYYVYGGSMFLRSIIHCQTTLRHNLEKPSINFQPSWKAEILFLVYCLFHRIPIID